jgi:glycosyltransferase involved in cell wall biosynthesis
MKPLRCVLVTRRFWPLVGGAEVVMANLGAEFHQRDISCQILTAQWQANWPTEFVHREVPVVRLRNPKQRIWGTFRYLSSLARWLKDHADQIDIVYVSMLKHDAYMATKICRQRGIPVVLRAEGGGDTGDCHWQTTARFGLSIRRRCKTATAVIAPSQAVAEELLAAGYPTDNLHLIPNGVALPAKPAENSQQLARQALAEANQDLVAAPEEPVVVYTGRLDRNKGLYDLVKAWPEVTKRWPRCHLWLVGEGPDRDRLFQQIKDLDLQGQVVLPGVFDDVEEVLRAANLFILPSYFEGLSISLMEAMAHQVPVIASNIPGNNDIIQSGVNGCLVPAGNVSAISQAIRDALANPDQLTRWATAAQQTIQNNYSLASMVNAHLKLFEQLVT